MNRKLQLIHPSTLRIGASYLYRERNGIGYCNTQEVVRFLGYDPCPATVVVNRINGINQRCLREELFTLVEIIQQ